MEQNKQKYLSGRDALTTEQIEKLMNSFDKISDKALIQLAIACGIRRADIVAISRADLDLENRTLRFREINDPSFVPTSETQIQT